MFEYDIFLSHAAQDFQEVEDRTLDARIDRVQRLRENRATSSTCGVWRNWSTGVTPSIV